MRINLQNIQILPTKIQAKQTHLLQKKLTIPTRKNTDSSSTVQKGHDSYLKTGDTHNVKKEYHQIILMLNLNLISL